MTNALRRWIVGGALLFILAVTARAWLLRPSEVPNGFAMGNGRIEADEVGVATKYAGRVEQILVEEGELVGAGQQIAQMDVFELDAELREAKALEREAIEQRNVAVATIAQRKSECELAEKEFDRATQLLAKRVAPQREVDIQKSRLQTAKAACEAAEAQLSDTEAAIDAARARVARIEARVDEATLVAPVPGRVLYRLAEPGEVLGVGGRVVALIDLTDVYMEIFLPSRDASRVSIGAEARIVLDAIPSQPIPAVVSFVAPQAQFTPKQVETRAERDKLMFRIKVRVPEEIVEPHIEAVKTGVRGVAYVRLVGSDAAPWPDFLETPGPSVVEES